MAKIHDIDAMLGADEPVHTTKVKLFGREWTVNCDVNAFALSALTTGDAGAIVDFFKSVIAEDEWSEFRTAMATARNLTGEKLVSVVNGLVEAATARPTTQPSVSSRGAVKKTSSQKSTANSSSTRVVRSVR